MKIGRGKLQMGGMVSVPVTHDGSTRRLQYNPEERYRQLERLELWTHPDEKGWSTSESEWEYDDCRRRHRKLVHRATAEELEALWAEVQRAAADPVQQARAGKHRDNVRQAQDKAKLASSKRKVKEEARRLLSAGMDVEQLRQQLVQMVDEAIVEAVQET